jgi:hypothetical protein
MISLLSMAKRSMCFRVNMKATRRWPKPPGFVHNIVDQFSWLPRTFAEETNDQLERAHFSTWWGVIMLRDDYTNPYVSDLYYLHEFYHAARMPYIPTIGMAAFDEKMQRNELEASVLSEVQVYFELPELRALSFDHPIYADLLEGRAIPSSVGGEPGRVYRDDSIHAPRRDGLQTRTPHGPDRAVDQAVCHENAVYSATWADRYREVESVMADFQINTVRSTRYGAAEGHRVWIETEAARDPVDNIPFRQEAELFTAFYWANKAKYSEAMIRGF